MRLTQMRQGSFYSILVRLKGFASLGLVSVNVSFYSILVRLKVFVCYGIYSDAGFLFHTGSIKRKNIARSLLLLKLSFYSILVRLKGSSSHRTLYARNKFLFHTGSIKSLSDGEYQGTLLQGFYSILVRLKVHAISERRKGYRQVSIPYWFD